MLRAHAHVRCERKIFSPMMGCECPGRTKACSQLLGEYLGDAVLARRLNNWIPNTRTS